MFGYCFHQLEHLTNNFETYTNGLLERSRQQHTTENSSIPSEGDEAESTSGDRIAVESLSFEHHLDKSEGKKAGLGLSGQDNRATQTRAYTKYEQLSDHDSPYLSPSCRHLEKFSASPTMETISRTSRRSSPSCCAAMLWTTFILVHKEPLRKPLRKPDNGWVKVPRLWRRDTWKTTIWKHLVGRTTDFACATRWDGVVGSWCSSRTTCLLAV